MPDERIVISLLSIIGILENVPFHLVAPTSLPLPVRTSSAGNDGAVGCTLLSIRPVVYEVKLVLDSESEHVNGQVVFGSFAPC